MSRYQLSVVNKFNENLYGELPHNMKIINNHFINETSVTLNEFINEIKDIRKYENNIKNGIIEKYYTNEDILNSLLNVLNSRYLFGLQIIQHIEINNYYLAVIKTHWIRLVQRRWKNVFKQRKNAKKNLFNLRHREIYGKFPDSCNIPFKLGI
jgi:hypothetical protein